MKIDLLFFRSPTGQFVTLGLLVAVLLGGLWVWSGTDAQYLGFNFNVMDSSTAPGVTSTEPGGLESREMMRIVDMIAKRGGVSVIDLTELCPIFDISGTAARLAACVIMRLMASLAAQDGDVIDDKLRRTDLVAAE